MSDHSKAIISSLFKPAANGAASPEEYIAHLQTYEEVPGSKDRKPRFLIISAARGGQLKLHKAKENANKTFSTGKTWQMEDLRSVEVIKSLEFILIINGKSYRYETGLPGTLQATFLVTLVRCWRAFMAGKGQPDVQTIGFNVTSPTARPTISPQASSSHQPLAIPPASSSASSGNRSSQYSTASGSAPALPSPINMPPRPANPPSLRTDALSLTRSISSTNMIPRSSPVRPSASANSSSTRPPMIPTISLPVSNMSRDRLESPSTTTTQPMLPSARTQKRLSIDSIEPSSFRAPEPLPIPPIIFPSKPVNVQPIVPPVADTSYTSADTIDEETVLANVEEMLEGFEWRGGVSSSGWGGAGNRIGASSKADEIEKRLVGELKALEAASIHAIIESDDRVTFVIENLDDAIVELDRLDAMFRLYRAQLNVMNDDIAHIEGQNRGLQVQTSNQRSLLAELDNLMETIHIDSSDLAALSQESLSGPEGIERLERAAVSLYKALLSTRDTPVGDMAAASERVEEYRLKAAEFCKRLYDFLAIAFNAQIDQLLHGKGRSTSAVELPSHAPMEDFLGRYCGLMLFVKEIDQARYQQICAAYFTAMSSLHRTEISSLLFSLKSQIKKPSDDDMEATFSPTGISPTLRQGTIRRAGTLVRGPLDSAKKEKEKEDGGKMPGSEAFKIALGQIAPHVIREQGFIADLLHINPLDASITFADYMMLDSYFRRGATSYLASQQGKLKEIRSAMEMVFGFLEVELRNWIDALSMKDPMQIVGVLAALDRIIQGEEYDRNDFLPRALQKQHVKSVTVLENLCKEQLKAIEQTKLTLKKRKGVVAFVKVFSPFVSRVESQLEGAEGLRIRDIVDANYERIAATMFDSLQHMAKMNGEGTGAPGEDKDQLNYHVILIENMHHLMSTLSKNVPSLAPLITQAKEKYSENLDLYIKLILRRPLAKLVDYFSGLEQILRTTPPNEVTLHSAYTRQALKRATSSLSAKDLRKAIDVLYKRVDKHFGSDGTAGGGTMLKTVWKACEEELRRLAEGWKEAIETCYPEEKGLEFNRDDISSDFKRAAMTS